MLENISNVIREGGEDTSYRFIPDNLNTICSETLVQKVAALIGCKDNLDVKGRNGTLKSTAS